MLQTDIGDVSHPRHIRPINGYITEKIGIDLMLFIRIGQSFSGIDRLYPENPHQTLRFVSADFKSSSLQLPAHPPAPVYGEIHVNFIHFIENPLILFAKAYPFVIERGPVKREDSTLIPYAQLLVILFHKFLLYRLWSCLYFFFRNSSSMFCLPIFLYSSSKSFFCSSISGSFFFENRLVTFSRSCFFHWMI